FRRPLHPRDVPGGGGGSGRGHHACNRRAHAGRADHPVDRSLPNADQALLRTTQLGRHRDSPAPAFSALEDRVMSETGGEAAIGIDFGTTNTVVALAGGDGEARLIQFAHDNQQIAPFRSALSFHADIVNPRDRVVEAGPWAIDAYVEEPLETRFIQS